MLNYYSTNNLLIYHEENTVEGNGKLPLLKTGE